MGLGHFGGGAGAARWFAARGADVLVTDLAPPERLGAALGSLADLVERGAIRLRLGEHNVSDFTDTDFVVANPAVPKPWENRFLRSAAAAGVPVTTEIALVAERLPERARALGVTGTAGKSTTAAMIDHVLREAGRTVVFGGNIGGSLLPVLHTIGPETFVVLELSSAMLHWLGAWSPGVAVVTNFAGNHLDWHGSLGHYRESKQRILRSQRPGDGAALGPGLSEWETTGGVRRVELSEHDRLFNLAIPGEHNRTNAALALAGARLLDPSLDATRAEESLRLFRGLAHRLELVVESGGVRFFNDSKSTTPESTVLAVRAFGEAGLRRVHLIAGGYDKGASLAPIARLADELGGLYTIGATGAAIAADAGAGAEFRGDLPGAVALAMSRLRDGDILLLSPGCASWDQFVNYEERGNLFRELVTEHLKGAAPR